MDSLAQYLNEPKELKGFEKDSDLARLLNVSRAYISQIRSGQYMGEAKCYEMALMLNLEPLKLLSLNRAIRNKDRRLKEYWLTVYRKTV